MNAINKPWIIEQVLQGLEMAESMYDHIEEMKSYAFLSDKRYLDTPQREAKATRETLDAIIRSIGGIPLKYTLKPQSPAPVTILGVTAYNQGNWHFPYREGHLYQPNSLLAAPTGWLRSAYSPLSPEQIRR